MSSASKQARGRHSSGGGNWGGVKAAQMNAIRAGHLPVAAFMQPLRLSISRGISSKESRRNIMDSQKAHLRLRDVAKKKKRENVGIFPKWGTPPSPLFGNDMFFLEKNYGLFCILGPFFGGSPM